MERPNVDAIVGVHGRRRLGTVVIDPSAVGGLKVGQPEPTVLKIESAMSSGHRPSRQYDVVVSVAAKDASVSRKRDDAGGSVVPGYANVRHTSQTTRHRAYVTSAARPPALSLAMRAGDGGIVVAFRWRPAAGGRPHVVHGHCVSMSPITTHVLDVSAGRPARGVGIRLEVRAADGEFHELVRGATDHEGRVADLLPEGSLRAATYRLSFETARYWEDSGKRGFYPEVAVVFTIDAPTEQYHVPLLLSPFGYSTYRS